MKDYIEERAVEIAYYILSCYEALHTTGANYVIDDIDAYLEQAS